MYISLFAIIGIIISIVVCLSIIYPYYTSNNSALALYTFLASRNIISRSTLDQYYLQTLERKKKVGIYVVTISIITVAVGLLLNGALAAGYLGGLLISAGIAEVKSRNSSNALEQAFRELITSTHINWHFLEEEYQHYKWHPFMGNETFTTFCDWYGHSEERRLYLLRTQTKNNY